MAPALGLQPSLNSRARSSAEASCSGSSLPFPTASRRAQLRPAALRSQSVSLSKRRPGLVCQAGFGQRAGGPYCGLDSLEREYERVELSNRLTVPTTAMAKLSGSLGGVTIERTKLDLSQKVQTVEPKLSNDGGGGDIGNKIFNGGGGDGDDGDDDDYFNFDDDGGDGDDGFWRTAVKELYDEVSLNAVLQEWFRSFADLPAIIRQSVQLGLFSSAQLVRFLSMDVRPNLTRRVTRVLPPKAARGVVGRLMADPAFMQKMVIEQLITVALSVHYEMRQRGAAFRRELDFVALNTATAMAATGAIVYLVAPTRSYGAVHKFPWQNMLHNLPNHVFDASTPYRRFSAGSRIGSLFTKAAELCAVGSLTGAAQSLGGSGLIQLRRIRDKDFKPSLAVPELKRNSCGLAAYMGTLANFRYQILGGFDRYLFERMTVLPVYLLFDTIVRGIGQCYGHSTRLYSQGLPLRAPARAAAALPGKRRVVRRRTRRKPSSAPPPPPEDFAMSAQMLRMQQLQSERQQHAMA